jgi:hypothetical protein
LSVAITQASCGGDSASAKESCTPLVLCSVNGASAASVAGSAAYAARVACSSALAGAAVRAAPLLALPIALELFEGCEMECSRRPDERRDDATV